MHCPIKGASVYQHLKEVEKQTGETPKELKAFSEVFLPEISEEVWEWFVMLHRRRTWGEHGPTGLSFIEIDAWSRLTGIVPSFLELDFIVMLDNVFIDYYITEKSRHRT